MGDGRIGSELAVPARRCRAWLLAVLAIGTTTFVGVGTAQAAPPLHNWEVYSNNIIPYGYSGPSAELRFGESVAAGTLTWAADGNGLSSCTRGVTAGDFTYHCSLNGLLPGTYTLSAAFSGGGGFDGFSTGAMTPDIRINKADSAITYTGPMAVDAGALVPVSATLRGDDTSSTAAISGATLNFSVPGGGQCAATTDATGTGACTLLAPNAPGTLTITYGGSAGYNGDTATAELALNRLPTTTTVAVAPSSATWGTAATATATITPSAATGTVAFSDESGPIAACAAQVVSGGKATCLYALPAGQGTVTAAYSGSLQHLPSASAPVSTLGQPRVSTLDFQPLPSFQVGVAAYVTAVLSDAGVGFGVNGANVTFTLGGIPCPAPVATNAAGVAGCFITPQNVADTTLVATFAGTPRYFASTAGPTTVAVAKANTTTTVASPGAAFGATATITATVAAADGGTVDFRVGGESLPGCSAAPVTPSAGAWRATCTAAGLPVGTTTVTANYSGTANAAASTGTGAVTIAKAATNLTYTGTTTATVDGSLIVAATLRSSVTDAGLGGRAVTFSWPGGDCATTTDGSGNAGCTLDPVATAGPATLTVGFAQTAEFEATSAMATIAVGKATSATVLGVPSSAIFGEPLVLSALVVPGTTTGTVTFDTDGTPIGGCVALPLPVAGGEVRCPTSALAAGARTIGATYGGDGNYEGSADHLPMTVSQAPTALAYTGAISGTVGQPVTMRATLERTGAAPGPLAGRTVSFTGAGGTCSATTNAAGLATCTITPDQVADGGAVSATFTATNEYHGASAPSTLTIAKAPTTASLDAPTTAVFGEAVTLTATVAPSVGGGTMSFSHLPEIGTATFIPGCIDLALTLVGGDWTATCTTAVLTAGRIAVNAHYTGDADYRDTADSSEMLVTPAPTLLEYTGDETGTVVSPVTLAATLTALPNGGTPVSGATVEFVRGDLACTAVTDASGSASCDVTPTAIAQSGPVQVSFAATREYQASTAEGAVEVVATATTTALAGPTTTGFSLPVQLTATIVPPPPGGTVAFTDGATPIAGCESVAVVPGTDAATARCTTAAAALGAHSVVATFGGTDSYLTSASTPHALTVVPAATNLAYTGPASATVGVPVTVSATLTAAGPDGATPLRAAVALAAPTATAVPGQQLRFGLGDAMCTAVTDANGVATCALTPLTTDAVTLIVTFTGAPGFEALSIEVPFAAASAPVPPTTPGTPTTADPGNPTLPATGSDPFTMLALACAALVAGIGATRLRRRHT